MGFNNIFRDNSTNLLPKLSRSHNSLFSSTSNNEPVYLAENEGVSFEGLLKENEKINPEIQVIIHY